MSYRKAIVKVNDRPAGRLEETEAGYVFRYFDEYVKDEEAKPVSLTLPKSQKVWESPVMFSFFDGLIPEGWLLDLTVKTWKFDARDRMGLLLVACSDCIGNVSISEAGDEEG